jgi:uncharacterized membrane protein
MQRKLRYQSADKRSQRGATAVLAAIAIVAILTAVMTSVEIGRLYAAHRNLQKVASMAALDAVRVVGGCDTVDVPPLSDVDERVRDSLRRSGADPSIAVASTGGVALGYVSTFNSQRDLQSSSPDEATSVGVLLSQPLPTPFLPLVPSDPTRRMTAHAIATQDVIGVISIGSSLLSIDSSRSSLLNGLMTGVLGGGVNLSVASWQGLAKANLTLKELAAAAGVATPGDLLSLHLTRNQALEILGDALDASGDAAEHALGNTLHTLAGIVDPHAKQITFGDVIGVEDTTEEIVGDLPINTLDLLTALSEDVAAGYPITLPIGVVPMLPVIGAPSSVSGLTAILRIGQPPQIGVGRPGYREDGTPRTVARTSQIFLQLNAAVADVTNVLGLPVAGLVGLNNGGTKVSLGLAVEVAAATAALREVRCAHSGQPHHNASADVTTALANVVLGKYANNLAGGSVAAPLPLGNVASVKLPLLGTNLLSIDMPSVVPLPSILGHDETVDFNGNFVPKAAQIVASDHVREVGSGVDATVDDVGDALDTALSGIAYGGTVGNALNLLAPLTKLTKVGTLLAPLAGVLDKLLGDVLSLAGIELGTATVTMNSLEVKQPVVFVKE